MPWRAASPVDQRTQFVSDHLRDVLRETLSSTCVTQVAGLFCYLCPRPFSLQLSVLSEHVINTFRCYDVIELL